MDQNQCPSCHFDNAKGTYFCGRCQLYLRPVGDYHLTRLVGKGGFASVFHAQHATTSSPAAVKIMHREFLDRDDIQERFAREARVMKELDHPNVVKLYDYGELTEESLGIYLIMEWCQGQTLHQAMQEQPHHRFGPGETKRYIEQLLQGLKHIHSKGIVHRDLKPGNLILQQGISGPPSLKILDFGLAWVDGKALTRSDVVIGSLLFMSPEQIRGRKDLYGPSTDLYAVGLLLAWMLTGNHIFGDVTREQIMVHHVMETPPTLETLCPEVRWSDSMEALIARALDKDPNQRYASADEMLQALQRADWPDFAGAETMPALESFVGEPAPRKRGASFSPYDDTGAIEPHQIPAPTKSYGAEANKPSIINTPKVQEEASFGELEGNMRPRRRKQSKPIIWVALLATLGFGAWKLMPRTPSPTKPIARTTNDAGSMAPEKRSISLSQLKTGSITPDQSIPAWIADLLQKWVDAWQATTEKPFPIERREQLKALYHKQFLDVTRQRDREQTITAMARRGQNATWMRINVAQLFVHANDKDKLVLQFRLNCFGSTMRAQGSGDLTGSTFKREGLVMMEWKREGTQWQIWRSIWQPLTSANPRETPPITPRR